jgi:plasmid stability protein
VRTTLTLDEDVAAKLKAEARRSGRSFKEVVNDLLRLALNSRRASKPAKRFEVKTRDLGLRPGFNLDKISELIEQLEGPFHR